MVEIENEGYEIKLSLNRIQLLRFRVFPFPHQFDAN